MTTPTAPNSRRVLGLKELVAMGVGGMIGGGIFSVLGLAAGIAGHAAPLAFLLGSGIAVVAGYSYARLAVTYQDDGASFTFIEKAFPRHPNFAGVVGWVVIVGYVGTLALYAFTFGAYGADLLGSADDPRVRWVLALGVLSFFLVVNLMGAKSSGKAEDIVVYTKIALLALFAAAGLSTVHHDYLLPVVNRGVGSVFSAGALIFVAYEGFQLITNAVNETRDASRLVPWGIYLSIAIVSTIYVVLAIVGVGNLTPDQLRSAEEYALAEAARPVLGSAGPVLVGITALLATSSAINATVFGASRMMDQMARSEEMPQAFSFRSRSDVPWLAVIVLIGAAGVFTALGGLETIASFSSMTFLLVSLAVSVANLRLRSRTRARVPLVLAGIVLMLATIALMVHYLATTSPHTLWVMAGIYCAAIIAELAFSKRRLIFRPRARPKT